MTGAEADNQKNEGAAERVLLVYGPTASGKSALALALAERTGALIVNADALQVYADWRVLSARPSPDEEARAEHRLYGHVDAAEPGYSVGRWLEEAAGLLDAAQAQSRAVIVIGGTGLYFTALTEGLAEIPPVPNETRAAVLALLERDGLDAAMAALRQRDPATAARVDPNNPRRVARALEVLEATGRGLADWAAATPPPRLPRSRATALVLDPDSDALARRIERRFHAMVEEGALAEVEAVRARGLDPALPAMRAHGAPALGRHLDGLCTLDAAIEAATTETRQYAKRQRTWARNRFADWERIRPEANFSIPAAVLEDLLARIAQR